MAKGCYLTFSEASQGTLFLHWSETPVAGALAFFEPRKNVPAFKYKSNGGRSELIREMSGGTGERIKRFYQRANRIYGGFVRHRRDVCSMAYAQAFTRASASSLKWRSRSTLR